MRGAAKGLGLAVLLSALSAQGALAAGCPCPKSQMIELYGSVSMFPNQLPGPRVHQPTAQKQRLPLSTTTVPSMAEVTRSFKTPSTDRITNPLLWDTLFVQQ